MAERLDCERACGALETPGATGRETGKAISKVGVASWARAHKTCCVMRTITQDHRAQEQSGTRVSHHNTDHQLRIEWKHQAVEQTAALGKRPGVSTRSQTRRRAGSGTWSGAWKNSADRSGESNNERQTGSIGCDANQSISFTRCQVFQNRADIMFIVNELCQRMSDPAQHSLIKLKRQVWYLQRERQ